MRRDLRWKWLLLSILLAVLVGGCSDDDGHDAAPASSTVQEASFSTSLHGTRAGKGSWYNDVNGFGSVVDVAYADLPCVNCHNSAVWEGSGVAYEGPNCLDCHEGEAGGTVAMPDTCYGCHSRQKTEIALGLTDVHTDAVDDNGDGTVDTLGCMDCHSSEDVHGDGTAYDTMLAPGAVDADCANCHDAAELADANDYHDATHMDAIDCSACHMESVITCYNCHFDNEAIEDGSVTHAKFASAKFGGPGEKSWRYLVNRVIDDQGNTKIFPGSMQTLMADVTAAGDGAEDGQGATFVGIGPYYSHSIKKNAITCEDCHASAALQQYVDTGAIDVVKWNGADGEVVPAAEMGSKWQPPKGVIPVPPDYAQALRFEFVDLVDPTAPLNASGTSSSDRVAFKRQADVIHLLDKYVKPLTEEQMAKLGWFATSLHATRQGKETWYTDGIGEASPAALQQGFGNFVDVPYDHLPCVDCHNAAAWTDADGVDQWPGNPVCRDCHSSENPASDPAVAADTCYGCHSRQAKENTLGMANVHSALGCASCHPMSDLHGDGAEKGTMFAAGAVTAACQDCHGVPVLTAGDGGTHEDAHTIHAETVDCSACHMESAIACYNCHFDNEVDSHEKFASGFFGGTIASGKSWRFLVNRVMPDGSTRVFPGSMQSLMADAHSAEFPGDDDQGVTFVGIGPYFAHAVMPKEQTLGCADCHATEKAIALAAGNTVDVVRDANQDGAWDATPQGVIPVPENTALLNLDFVDLVDPATNADSPRKFFKTGADVVHMPSEYVRPLDANQLNILSNGCAICHQNTLPGL